MVADDVFVVVIDQAPIGLGELAVVLERQAGISVFAGPHVFNHGGFGGFGSKGLVFTVACILYKLLALEYRLPRLRSENLLVMYCPLS